MIISTKNTTISMPNKIQRTKANRLVVVINALQHNLPGDE